MKKPRTGEIKIRKKYNFFSTHHLTVLTISVILQLEQRKGINKKPILPCMFPNILFQETYS